MNDDLADIAEDRRKARWIGNQRRAAHAIWLGLTEAEKNHWRTLARVLLAAREQQRVPSSLSEWGEICGRGDGGQRCRTYNVARSKRWVSNKRPPAIVA
jgi:hypothetical protein